MRILMLTPCPGIRGPIMKHTPVLIDALHELGCQVQTATWGASRDNENIIEKIKGRVWDIIYIRRILNQKKFEVFIVKTAHDWGTLIRDILLLLLTYSLRPATILQFHGSQPGTLLKDGRRFFKKASRLLLRLTDANMVLSSEEQIQFKDFCPECKFHVVQNPLVPVNGFFNNSKKITDKDELPKLLFVGRIMREKGVLDVLEAAHILHERKFPVSLVIAGDGPASDELVERVKKSRIKEFITVTGYLEGKQLWEIYSDAHLLALPTRWDEGFPTVIAEAMQIGLPIVTTQIRGAADHLEDGINTIFVPSNDSDALANAIQKILSDRRLMKKMQNANREKAKTFEGSQVARRYLQIIEEVLKGN